MTQVKVCGLMTAADVALVNALRPDLVGFVLAAGRHQRTTAEVLALAKQVAPGIRRVAVVVAPDFDQLASLASAGTIDTVQFHRPATLAQVQRARALGLTTIARVSEASPETPADVALVDAGDGSGQTLDWRALPAFSQPLMLAGGLDAANVAQAIALVHPAIVDASSRLETGGAKDPAKVAAFIAAARNAE
ncbi:phosphoribosylanthranilate isomerase [Lacticaseibacillus mingshuiensis]|uniref:N-(5'-phosphoribosyl)anthranilate isomerase n=1 Tax=Lacticaseibacillus mingshuiensis TaxID=2799574 RepID=A0ABW4CED0_9LACO|nr:phosphoribosylanthranilate isomerase [Lacticaseibacillus mingshuiensis]